MGRLQGSLPRKSLLVATLAGGWLANSNLAYGQAIVTYGVNVGRAAGAGAAAGTGAAGIFDKLNKTTANAANHEAKGKPSVKPNSGATPSPSSPNTITIGGNGSAGGAGETGAVRTASGISIAGLTAPKPPKGGIGNATAEVRDVPDSASPSQASSPLSEPEGFRLPEAPLPEPAPDSAASPHRSEAAATVSEAPPNVRDGRKTLDANPAKQASSPPKTPALVIAEGITSKGAPATSAGAAPFTITAGTPIQDVIKLLGQPLMRLSGVAGADYDERYVFVTANGPKLTILTKDGLVLRVTAD